MSGVDILAMHAAARPEKVALVEGRRTLTFAQLNARANRVAHAFLARGVVPGTPVAAMTYNSILGSQATHGFRKLRAIGVPINYRLKADEVAYLLRDSGARVVLAGPDFVAVVDAACRQLEEPPLRVALDPPGPAGWESFDAMLAEASEDEPPALPGEGLGASMIYTSGTTGKPKAAYRPGGVTLEYVLQVVSLFELGDTDVHLLCGPGYHSAVALFSQLHQLLGATVVIQPRFEAEEALRLIDHHRVTTTFMAPTLLQRLVDLPEEVRRRCDTSSLRAILLGAAPCPAVLKERAIALFGQCLWEFYGATETGINTVLRPEDQLRKPGSCGRAVPGQEIRLLDAEGAEVPDGTPGEFWVRNTSLAEYYGRPEVTAGSMRDGFFSVGDIAYRDSEGYYYICDRRVDMVISGGVNIYPAEVEAVLHAHPAVRDAAVIGVPDAHWGESVKALVVPRAGIGATEGELIAWCGARLADYKKPRSVEFVEELPRDAAGKLLKRQIREPFWAGAGRRV